MTELAISQHWSAIFCATGVWGGKPIGRVRVKESKNERELTFSFTIRSRMGNIEFISPTVSGFDWSNFLSLLKVPELISAISQPVISRMISAVKDPKLVSPVNFKNAEIWINFNSYKKMIFFSKFIPWVLIRWNLVSNGVSIDIKGSWRNFRCFAVYLSITFCIFLSTGLPELISTRFAVCLNFSNLGLNRSHTVISVVTNLIFPGCISRSITENSRNSDPDFIRGIWSCIE